jgi:predicted SprT family Zn-dependent metalloprotease
LSQDKKTFLEEKEMKDLQKYYQQGLIFLEGYGIKCGNIKKVEPNTRAKNRWGCAHGRKVFGETIWTIDINVELLKDEIPDTTLMNTLVHELLHTVEGCHGHTGKWKALADKITATSDLVIKRTSSYEEKNIERPEYNYILKCEKCGAEIGRHKMSDFVRRPQAYTHTGCGGHFMRIK